MNLLEEKNMDTKNHPPNEKRVGPDILVLWVKLASYLVWLILGIYLLITDLAKPENATFFDNLLNVNMRKYWDQNLLYISFLISLVLFVLSFLSIMVNIMRLKRKTDHLSISLIITLILSSLGILVYMTSFM